MRSAPIAFRALVRYWQLLLLRALPTLKPSDQAATRYYAEVGGLVSCGVDNLDLYSRAGSYVDRILRGEKPSDLPVQEPTKFQLVINLKTAKALGLTIPQSLLTTADELIE